MEAYLLFAYSFKKRLTTKTLMGCTAYRWPFMHYMLDNSIVAIRQAACLQLQLWFASAEHC